jgi:hypothetical protein
MDNSVEVTQEEAVEADNYEEFTEAVAEVVSAVEAEEDTPAEEPVVEGPRANRRATRRARAHVPGPRRRPNFATPPGYDPETGYSDDWQGAEEESVAEAPAEAEDSDEGGSDKGKKSLEDPITFGSIDG